MLDLYCVALAAFIEYNPVEGDPQSFAFKKIHRSRFVLLVLICSNSWRDIIGDKKMDKQRRRREEDEGTWLENNVKLVDYDIKTMVYIFSRRLVKNFRITFFLLKSLELELKVLSLEKNFRSLELIRGR